jgi:hypothetical protein
MRPGEEIDNYEPGPGDMEADPALAREEEVVPPWREQVTLRGMVAALLIGFIYSVIVMKLALTTGLVPNLNVSAALLSFLALRGWTLLIERLGLVARPFTRQENTVIETCAVACFDIASAGRSAYRLLLLLLRPAVCMPCFRTDDLLHSQYLNYCRFYPFRSGGFGSTLLGLDKKSFELTGDSPANVPGSYKDPAFGWMAALLLAISFAGLLNLIPLRKVPFSLFICISFTFTTAPPPPNKPTIPISQAHDTHVTKLFQ